MLQDKYGRLIVVGAFVVIGLGLLIAPGVSSKKKALEVEQLNFTSMPKEEIKKDIEKSMTENTVNSDILSQNSILSAEEKMLDGWGMRKIPSKENVQAIPDETITPEISADMQAKADETVKNIVEKHEKQESTQIKQPVEQSQQQKQNNIKSVIKVNGKCFAPPTTVKPLTKSECEDPDNNFGIKSCLSDENSQDSWAGAVKHCGGVMNMPDIEDLLAIARILYAQDTISIRVTEQYKYKAFGQYSPVDGECDSFKFDSAKYDSDKAVEYGFRGSAGYNVWGGLEISPSYALSLMFSSNSVEYNSCTKKTFQPSYTICRVPCKE